MLLKTDYEIKGFKPLNSHISSWKLLELQKMDSDSTRADTIAKAEIAGMVIVAWVGFTTIILFLLVNSFAKLGQN